MDQERLYFTLASLLAGLAIAAICARAAPGSPEEKQTFSKSNCQIQTPSLSQRRQSLIKPLLKNNFSIISQGPGPGEALFHFSRFVCWVRCCSKLCQSSSWKPRRLEEKQAISKQLPNSNSRPFPKEPIPHSTLIKEQLLIWKGHGPGEAPFHFSRFVCWARYCSKLCQSSSWKPRREASLFQKQLPNSFFWHFNKTH